VDNVERWDRTWDGLAARGREHVETVAGAGDLRASREACCEEGSRWDIERGAVRARSGLLAIHIAVRRPTHVGRVSTTHLYRATRGHERELYVTEDRLRALYTLALTTGLRRSEVLGLAWDRVDLQDGHLVVVQALVEVAHRPKLKPFPKTDHSRRRIALDAGTIRELKAHRRRQLAERLASRDQYQDDGLAFAEQNGSPLLPSTVSRRFARLASDAGLPDLSPRPFHGLRHTYATLALEAGVPIELLSKRLGHASIATTADLYQHVTKSMDRDAAEAVAGLIFGGS